MASGPDAVKAVQSQERGTVSYSAVISCYLEVVVARSISALKRDPENPRRNLSFRRTADVLVQGEGKYARTFGRGLDVEYRMLDNSTGTVAVLA